VRSSSGCIGWAALEILPIPLALAKRGALPTSYATRMTPRYSASDETNFRFSVGEIRKTELVLIVTWHLSILRFSDSLPWSFGL